MPIAASARTPFLPRLAHTLMAVGLLLALMTAAASAATAHLRIASNEMGRTQHLLIGVHKSVIVDLPAAAREVIVSQPNIANAIMRSSSRAIVQGVAGGDTNILFLDGAGRTISVLEVQVQHEPSRIGASLQATIARVLPGSRINVESVDVGDQRTSRVVLSGTALSEDDVRRAIDIAAQFAGDPANVASVVNVAGSQQVMLKVTVAEVSRETVRQLGINLTGSINGGLTTTLVTSPALGGASGVSVGNNGLGVNLGVGNVQLEATLRALERRGAMRTLAEPTLTAISGQEADFLAGGEFPVPVGVDADGRVTYEFKEFGVKLGFTPTVKSNGIVGLVVNTSVSELTTEGGINTPQVTIPATRERRASTSVELPSGSTLAIAGLIEERVRQQFNALPGLGNIPILGALFRSRDFVRAETELLILVTPILAESTPFTPQLPTDDFVVAGDAEAVFLGRMEKLYGVGVATGQGAGGAFRGSVGFVLD